MHFGARPGGPGSMRRLVVGRRAELVLGGGGRRRREARRGRRRGRRGRRGPRGASARGGAARVVLRGAGTHYPGLVARAGARVVLRGVTVTGFPGGVVADGGELSIEESSIDGNSLVGVYVLHGGTAKVTRSRVARLLAG